MIKLNSKIIFIIFLVLTITYTFGQMKTFEWKTSTSKGYTYSYITNDPTQSRFYKLKNGLTVILSSTDKQPRIQVYIAVKAGSKTDPTTHTGLAHYLEHMLFKGTNKFGTLNWDKEKVYLNQIQNLYAQYGATTDTAMRAEIYKKIDNVSGIAAKYAIANEYDKMMGAMGAKGTNAFTSFEQTVYTEDIPNNVIDKFLIVQAERFREPVFRLFHTELEAVYEEKNRSLDNDNHKVFENIFAALFPNNNYGKQTTIGTVAHLKNPSLQAIRDYFNTYYVPNNMGIIMSGDFNPDEVIQKIDTYFSYMTSKPIPEYKVGQESPITTPIVRKVYGPNAEFVLMGYRFPGASSQDARMLDLVGSLLTNGSAGLIDLNLIKKQKLLGAAAFAYTLKDYSVLLLQGSPSKGQTLDQVRDLLLEQIKNLSEGNFSDTLIQGVINNYKKQLIQSTDNYTSRAQMLMNDFTSGVDWKDEVALVQYLSTITKQDIVNFCKKYLSDKNYAIVYKLQGKDTAIVKVPKPPITPVSVNRVDESSFLKTINSMPEASIKPLWIDYNKDITKGILRNHQNTANGIEVLSTMNKDNNLFKLYYYYQMGEWNNNLLPIATAYLSFIGTKEKSTEQFSKDFYQLASSFNINVQSQETYIALEGLQENFASSVTLLEDLLQNCTVDTLAWDSFKQRMKKTREDNKKNKSMIMQGLVNYAFYGSKNPFNQQITNQELDTLNPQILVDIIHNLLKTQHKVLYYGNQTNQAIIAQLAPLHKPLPSYIQNQQKIIFKRLPQEKNTVLYIPYDMVQAEIYWARNTNEFDTTDMPFIRLFNNYFGGGMSSIVFQTIRESKALAYATYASYRIPAMKDDRETMNAYVGTQADKFDDAVNAMNNLLDTLPFSEPLFNNAKASVLKELSTERIIREGILMNYLASKKMGFNGDIRQKIYEQIPAMTFEQINQFHQQRIAHKPYTYCIIANGDNNAELLKSMQQYGELKKLTLEEIFGY